jgi:hypothetical protein
MIKAGDKFIGSVDGTVFEVIEFRSARADIGLKPDYTLSYDKGKTVHATENLLDWLLKSGGLVEVN